MSRARFIRSITTLRNAEKSAKTSLSGENPMGEIS